MVKIIMHGCCGHMGQVISDLAAKDAEAEIVEKESIEYGFCGVSDWISW